MTFRRKPLAPDVIQLGRPSSETKLLAEPRPLKPHSIISNLLPLANRWCSLFLYLSRHASGRSRRPAGLFRRVDHRFSSTAQTSPVSGAQARQVRDSPHQLEFDTRESGFTCSEKGPVC